MAMMTIRMKILFCSCNICNEEMQSKAVQLGNYSTDDTRTKRERIEEDKKKSKKEDHCHKLSLNLHH